MSKLLRVEAVNLDNSILDTDDLSTRRGGSYMLLQAINDIADRDGEFATQLKAVSTGASVGLFEVISGIPADAVDRVRNWLRSHKAYRHATFVVAAADDATFESAHELCIASCRWQQMQSLALSGAWAQQSTAAVDRGLKPVCEVDQVRPAISLERFGAGEVLSVSDSVRIRRFDKDHGGVDLRQRFYSTVAGDHAPAQGFTNDFNALAKADHDVGEDVAVPAAINDKIALFYADGNGFGRIQSRCGSESVLRDDWDAPLRAKRRKLLVRILTEASRYRRWRTVEGFRRLETLMWGGDELTLVVPAWCGLELADIFFHETANWTWSDGTNVKPLTHAASLVFAHRNAPIRRLESLAHTLVDDAKSSTHADRNSLSWITLESFDHAGADPSGYLTRRYPVEGYRPTSTRLRLEPGQLATLREQLPQLRDALPRSAIVRALRLLVAGQIDNPLLIRSYKSVTKSMDDSIATQWAELWTTVSAGRAWDLHNPTPVADDVASWTILLELWDYTLDTSSHTAVEVGGQP